MMRVLPFKIPKQIVLPGLIVQVHVVPPGHQDDEGDTLLSKYSDWDYDPIRQRAVVRIASDLTLPGQRYALIHELQHILVDYLHCALKYHPEKVMVE